ncbi:MAG TPA: hypothetical protein VKF41_03100, partial [Bryobacteraceae bacterium]|nr:hypothetical protein [Bryobacteraceae bacterium]
MKIPARKTILLTTLGATVVVTALFAATHALLPNNLLTGRNVNGMVFTVTNQLLRPWGRQALIQGRPVDLAIDADGGKLAVLNSNRVDVFDSLTGQLLGAMNTGSATYAGVAFRPGTAELWASAGGRGMRGGGGSGDTIAVATVDAKGHPGEPSRISLTGRAIPVGIGFTSDGTRAYVALNRNNTVAVVDAQTHKVVREIPVGMAPFGVAVAEGRGRVFVTNRGGRPPKPGENTSTSSGVAMLTDPVTGATTTGTVSVIGL